MAFVVFSPQQGHHDIELTSSSYNKKMGILIKFSLRFEWLTVGHHWFSWWSGAKPLTKPMIQTKEHINELVQGRCNSIAFLLTQINSNSNMDK